MTKNELRELVKSHFNLVEPTEVETPQVQEEFSEQAETPQTETQVEEKFEDKVEGTEVIKAEDEAKTEDIVEMVAKAVDEKMGDIKMMITKLEERMNKYEGAKEEKKMEEEKEEEMEKEKMSKAPAAEKTQPAEQSNEKFSTPNIAKKSRYEAMLAKLK